VSNVLENDLDRICFAIELLSTVEPVPLWHKKNTDEAKEKRMEGNALFQKKKVEEAFRAYNTSVLRAPHNQADVSIRLAENILCIYKRQY
jgi:hypothetical protein